MRNFGKYLANLSDSGILTGKELEDALLAILKANGDGSMRATVLAVSISQLNTMKGMFILSASVAMDSRVVNKRSTKKKSKKSTVKEPGKRWSLEAGRYVSAVK